MGIISAIGYVIASLFSCVGILAFVGIIAGTAFMALIFLAAQTESLAVTLW